MKVQTLVFATLTDTVVWLQHKLQVLFNGVKIPLPPDTAAEIGMKAGQEDFRAGETWRLSSLCVQMILHESTRVCTPRLP